MAELEELKGKNWVATMMLAWALGVFGAHRFYTGKQNTAWVMVVLTVLGCTLPISFLWAVIDTVMIALGNWKHEDGSELYERINWLGTVYLVLLVLSILGVICYFGLIIAMIAAIAGAGAGAGAGTGF